MRHHAPRRCACCCAHPPTLRTFPFFVFLTNAFWWCMAPVIAHRIAKIGGGLCRATQGPPSDRSLVAPQLAHVRRGSTNAGRAWIGQGCEGVFALCSLAFVGVSLSVRRTGRIGSLRPASMEESDFPPLHGMSHSEIEQARRGEDGLPSVNPPKSPCKSNPIQSNETAMASDEGELPRRSGPNNEQEKNYFGSVYLRTSHACC
jgi:hypothetical protein